MSDDDSPRLIDRPKLAQALANLKRGLRDSADPFFDGWKQPRAPAQALDNVAKVVAGPPNAADTVEQSVIDDALPTDIETPLGMGAAHASAPGADALPACVPPHDELNAPTLELEKVRIASSLEEVPLALANIERAGATTESDVAQHGLACAAVRRASLRDTVRVRLVRYHVFPRWALVLAAALLVFAGSVLALRAGYRLAAAPAVVLAASAPAPSPPVASELAAAPTADDAPVVSALGSPRHLARPWPGAGGNQERPESSAGAQRANPPVHEPRPTKPRDTAPPTPEFFREPGF